MTHFDYLSYHIIIYLLVIGYLVILCLLGLSFCKQEGLAKLKELHNIDDGELQQTACSFSTINYWKYKFILSST